ncbi:MAG: hypothetical protein ABRQ39_30645, partial [Candidatus Eremiobacterota bacterium]
AELNARTVGFDRQARKTDSEINREQNDQVSLGSGSELNKGQFMFVGADGKPYDPSKQGLLGADGKPYDPAKQSILGADGKPYESNNVTVEANVNPFASQETQTFQPPKNININNPNVVAAMSNPDFQEYSKVSPSAASTLLQLVDAGKITPDQFKQILEKDKARRDVELTLLKHEESERIAVRDALYSIEEMRAKAEMDRLKKTMDFFEYMTKTFSDMRVKRAATNFSIAESLSKTFYG